jgi:PTS system cellobiose-specific IIC component
MGVFAKPFIDSFMYIGGSGATLGLIVSTFALSKRRELKEIAKYATPAGVFQINEPVIFGYPIVLNPFYVVPFVLAPVTNVIIGWIFSQDCLGFVNYVYIATPWTTPWLLGSVLSTLDPRALVPALICFVASCI